MWKDIKGDLVKAKEPLSNSAWSKMHSELDVVKPVKKRFPFIYLFLIVGLLLIGFIGGKYFGKSDKSNSNTPQTDQVNNNIKTLDSTLEDYVNQSDSVSNKVFIETIETLIQPNNNRFKIEKKENPKLISSNNKKETKKANLNTDFVSSEFHGNSLGTPRIPSRLTNNFLELIPKGFDIDSPLFPGLDSTSYSISPQPIANPSSEFQFARISKFQLKVFGGPTFPLNDYTRQPSLTNTNRNYENAINEAVKPSLGYEFGLEFYYRFYGNLRMGSGVLLQEINTFSSFDYEITEIPVIEGSSGDILAYIPLPESRKVKHEGTNNFQYVTIPISLYMENRIHKKWLLSTEFIHYFGFLNSHLSTQVNTTTLELKETKLSELNSFVNSSAIKLGIQYQLSPTLLFGLEPTVSYSYQNLFNQEVNSWKPLQLGIQLSTTINLTNH